MSDPGDGRKEEDFHYGGPAFTTCLVRFITWGERQISCACLRMDAQKAMQRKRSVQVSAKDHSRFAGSYATILKVVIVPRRFLFAVMHAHGLHCGCVRFEDLLC